MMSFSRFGIPIFEQSPPWIESQPAKFTFSCVKISSMSLSGTPRSDVKWNVLRPMPTTDRPCPSVCARSAKIGPAELEVLTGTPPSNLKLTPPDVAPIGKLPTLVEIAPRDEADEASIFRDRRRHEVIAMRLDRRRVARIGRSGEEERVLPRPEDEELRDLGAQRVVALRASYVRNEERRAGDERDAEGAEGGTGWHADSPGGGVAQTTRGGLD